MAERSQFEIETEARLNAISELVAQCVAELWDSDGITILLDDSEDEADKHPVGRKPLALDALALKHRSRILEAALGLRLDSEL